MKRLLRRALIMGALLPALMGCDFTPVYGPEGPGTPLYGAITVEDPQDRFEFQFRDSFAKQLGAATTPVYRLEYRLRFSSSGLAITQSADITRYTVTGRASYSLIRLADRKVVERGNLQSIAGYSATGTTYAARIAERDAKERLAITLAEQIANRIYGASANFEAVTAK